MSKLVLVLLLASGVSVWAQSPSREQLDFLHGLDEYEHIRRMLPDYMEREAQQAVQARKRSLHIRDLEALAGRRQFVRDNILKAIGGLPERTPLNAHTVATLDREGYRIEKIVFESQPRFYVTANLYLPVSGSPPYPAILYPLGHELGGKSNPTWQQMLATLARKGYVALTWDTLGQGERVQIYSADLHDSLLRGSTTEHTILGIQSLLIGQAIARYTIWDGIRALDYLLSRKEVDPERVAVTGNSGGGTHTSYIAALDDRIKVAAPSCFLTSWHWMLKTIGPQDAEQVFPGWLGNGLDYPDFIYAAAPKPYLMLSAIRDFFPIDGARETFHEAQQVYSNLDKSSNIAMFEADDGHGYTKPRRLAAYQWFDRWLRNGSGDATEAPMAPETAETLNCTPTGQVVTSLGGETVSSMIRARAEELRQHRPEARDAADLEAYRERIRRSAILRTGYQAGSGPVPVTPYGTIERDGFHIDKFVYESEPGILVPALLYVANSGPARKPAVILVDGNGKAAAAATAEQLVRGGTMVLSIDLRGTGETRIAPDLNDSESYRYFGDYEDAMTAILLKRTLAGMRARDIVRAVDVLLARNDVDPGRLGAIGRRGGAIPLLYAAVFDARLKRIALENVLVSYDAVATSRMHRLMFEDVVPGALLDFDLPDLVSALAPRTVWMSDPLTPTGTLLPYADFVHEYARTTKAYSLAHAEGAVRLLHSRADDDHAGEYYRDLVR